MFKVGDWVTLKEPKNTVPWGEKLEQNGVYQVLEEDSFEDINGRIIQDIKILWKMGRTLWFLSDHFKLAINPDEDYDESDCRESDI